MCGVEFYLHGGSGGRAAGEACPGVFVTYRPFIRPLDIFHYGGLIRE